MEYIQKAVSEAVKYVLTAMTKDLGSEVLALLSRLLVTPIGLLHDLDLVELINYTRYLAWLILPVLLIVQGIRIAQDRADGAATVTTESFVRRAIIASLAVAGTTAITSWVLRFADSLISSFLKAGTGVTPLNLLFGLGVSPTFTAIFLTLILVVGFIVLLLQRAIMNAELAFVTAFGPLAATTLAWHDEAALWNTWLRETISLAATYVVQTALLWWLLRKLGSWGTDTFDSKLLVFGILVLMFKTPATIRQWTYSAGAGSAVLGGAATVGRLGMSVYMFRALPRAIFRR